MAERKGNKKVIGWCHCFFFSFEVVLFEATSLIDLEVNDFILLPSNTVETVGKM